MSHILPHEPSRGRVDGDPGAWPAAPPSPVVSQAFGPDCRPPAAPALPRPVEEDAAKAITTAWYPLSVVEGRARLLAHAELNAEDGDVDSVSFVVLDSGPGALAQRRLFGDLDDLEQELLLDELGEVASNRAHPNWKGWEALRDLAFPSRANGG